MYVFALVPNRSGSYALSGLIETSPTVSGLPAEGNHMPGWVGPSPLTLKKRGIFTAEETLLSDESQYNWNTTKTHFESSWEDKPIKYQKSPADLCRIEMIERHFQPIKWIAMVRNPLANAESIMRLRPDCTPAEVGRHLKRCYEIIGEQSQRNNVCLITYEDLCDRTELVINRLLDFIPEFQSLSPKKYPLKNYNERADKLSANDREIILREIGSSANLLFAAQPHA